MFCWAQKRKKQLNAAYSSGGESGIRTRDTLFTYTRFPGVLLQPLGHLTAFGRLLLLSAVNGAHYKDFCSLCKHFFQLFAASVSKRLI